KAGVRGREGSPVSPSSLYSIPVIKIPGGWPHEIEGRPRPARTENRCPNEGSRPALGTRLSTAVTRGVAAWPRDRNASHIASARDPATPEFGAKAKTLDPDPQRPKPVAPA